jgi:hypothetical protein
MERFWLEAQTMAKRSREEELCPSCRAPSMIQAPEEVNDRLPAWRLILLCLLTRVVRFTLPQDGPYLQWFFLLP